MYGLIIAIVIGNGVNFLPVEVYATRDMCEHQQREAGNRAQAANPGAKIRTACVPAVPGE
jgi:hypothetical protein